MRRVFRHSNSFYQYYENFILEAFNEFLKDTLYENEHMGTKDFLKRFRKYIRKDFVNVFQKD